jgi:hypothetical protein
MTIYAFVSPSGVPKVFALNSYSSFPFKPASLPLRQNRKPIAPNSTSPATIAPTAIPAFAPVERPLRLVDCEAERSVFPVFGVEFELGVGAANPSLVTLKHGTWSVKSLVSTNVCVHHQPLTCTVFRMHLQYQRRRRNSGSSHRSRPRSPPSTPTGSSHSVQPRYFRANASCSIDDLGRHLSYSQQLDY